ncbi:MAG TPA: hypothetical protein VNW15_07170 [Rhizomicrobium sp.]|nr:hypothetical protein [Rhizomicrobium sp.]
MKRFVILLPALILAGCSTDQNGPQCPSASVLSDTATLTVFRAGAPADPSGEAYTAVIVGVKSSCTYAKAAPTAVATFSFSVRATRAPSTDGATYTLPYYFAVTQGDRILEKKNASLKIMFAPGSADANDDENLADATITLEPGHPPTDYQLLVGFQLSDAERAYNQKRGRYTP